MKLRTPTHTDGWRLGHTALVFYRGDSAHGVETLLVAPPTEHVVRFTPEEAIEYGQKLVALGSAAMTKQRQLQEKEADEAAISEGKSGTSTASSK